MARGEPDRHVEVPIDYDPRVVQGDGPSARSAREAMTTLHGAWIRIRDAAADQTVDLPRLAKAAQSAMERALTVTDGALERITAQIGHIERDIVALTQPRVDPALASEIRAFWRQRGWTNGLPEAARTDARTASAVLSAPAYLSGLDDKQREVVRQEAVHGHAAERQAELDEARRAHDKIARAGSRMIELVSPRVRDWSQPDNANLIALEGMSRG